MNKQKIKEILESYLNVNDTIYSRDIPLIVEELSSLKAEKEVSDVPVIKGGWECPRCGQINAIWKSVCDCPPRTITSTTVNNQ